MFDKTRLTGSGVDNCFVRQHICPLQWFHLSSTGRVPPRALAWIDRTRKLACCIFSWTAHVFGNQVSLFLYKRFFRSIQVSANLILNAVWLGQSYALVTLIRSANLNSVLLKKCQPTSNYQPRFYSECCSVLYWPTIHRPDKLPYRDTFMPFFYGKHLRVNVQPVNDWWWFTNESI